MRSSYFFIFTLYQCIVMQYTSDTRVSNEYDFHACMKGHIHLTLLFTVCNREVIKSSDLRSKSTDSEYLQNRGRCRASE